MGQQDDVGIARLVAVEAVTKTNLYNAGLTAPSCIAAYRGALMVGASAEQAFEAARQEMLMVLCPREIDTQTQRLYQSGEWRREAARRAERMDRMAEARALPNPFSLQVAA